MNTRLMIEATKANKAGDCTVYVEVSITKLGEKKKTIRIPTNIKINASSWNAKSQSVIRTKSKDYYKINQTLIGQKELVTEIIAEFSQKGKFQLSQIKQRYIEKTAPITLDFFEVYDDFLNKKEESMTKNGVKDYKTLKKHLVNFEDYRKDKIIFNEIDYNFFENFKIYLSKQTITEKDKENGKTKTKFFADSTVSKNLQILRLYLNKNLTNGLPINMSYKKYKIEKPEQPTVITLEPQEYKLLLKKIDNERLDNVRKLFVLQCSTGLRYSDVIKIRKNHIRNNAIFINSTKTKQKLIIPLNNNSKEILIDCNYNTSTISISNQKYNDYIKELCMKVGINQELTIISYRGNDEVEENKKKYEIMSSHDGRRFFITQNLINGVRPEVIMSMTGHVDFRSFTKYIAITDTARFNAMNIWTKTFGK